MAHLTSPLVKKLKRKLTEVFPPPDTVKLEDDDGITGVITSSRFERMDGVDRQRLIRKILGAELSFDEQRQIQLIVGVTPDEETGYIAGPD